MRRSPDRIIQKIYEKLIYSSKNGCNPITDHDCEAQFRDMPEMEGLNREERYTLIRKKFLPARKKAQREDKTPVYRLWGSEPGLRNFVRGLQVWDGSEEMKILYDEDRLIDKRKAEGVIVSYNERHEIAHIAGALTRGEYKRYQLFGGEGKKIKKLTK